MIVIATNEELTLAEKFNTSNDEVILTGVGGLNVIEKLKDLDKDTPILNLGYVGSNNIPIGEVVKIDRVKLYHPNVEYDEPIYDLPGGDILCLTSNDFVLETKINTPVVFDMELAYIMALGFKNVTSIKVVSDNLNYDDYETNIKK